MVSHEQTRLARMNQLKNTRDELIEREAWCPDAREKMIAHACMDWGTTRRKILEYLKVIESL